MKKKVAVTFWPKDIGYDGKIELPPNRTPFPHFPVATPLYVIGKLKKHSKRDFYYGVFETL
jgi:hypothetical protein